MGFELFRLFRGGDATSQPRPAETPPGAGVQRPSFGRRVSGPVPVPPLSPSEPSPSPAAAEDGGAPTPSAPSPPAAEEQSAPTPSSPGPPAAEEQGAPTLSRPASPATEDRSAPTLKAFEPELQRLDLYQRGLGAAAIRYVANGEDSSLPRRVAALVAAVPRYQGPYHSDTKAKGEAAAIANLALMRPEIPAGHVARFLQLRLLVDPLQTPYGQPPLSEERQLIRAVFNAVRAALPKSVSDNDKTPCEQARSLRQMNELVRHCGGNMVDLFENLLGHDSAYYIVPGAWIEGSDCA